MVAVDQLKLRQPQQIAGMIDALCSALLCHLAVLPEEGRQLQLLQMVFQQHRRPLAHDLLPDTSVM